MHVNTYLTKLFNSDSNVPIAQNIRCFENIGCLIANLDISSDK